MPSVTLSTKFYKFHQNNSGGTYKTDDAAGIGMVVWIEALNPEDANARAENIGIYFEGVERGIDCRCCGDRWTTASNWDAVEELPENAKNVHRIKIG